MKKVESAVLVVDVQNDFCPGGSLAVKDGDSIVGPINKLLDFGRQNGFRLAASRDWHPRETTHFDKWPVHCVQYSEGAKFQRDLNLDQVTVFSKGLSTSDDGYSPFEGVDKEGRKLDIFLENVQRIFIGGLATDYCVRAAVLDALKKEFEVYLLLDGVKAVDLNMGDGEKTIKEMAEKGAKLTTIKEVLGK